jgi:Tol biopolymer transport system component
MGTTRSVLRLLAAAWCIEGLGSLCPAQDTIRVSVDSSGVQADDESLFPSLSSDGRFVVFESAATNLVPGDANQTYDVFRIDRATGAVTRVSVGPAGVEADSISEISRAQGMSSDGTIIVFTSAGDNLVVNDLNGVHDVFVRDTLSGSTVRASVDSSGLEADQMSFGAVISADGNVVAFESSATNLVSGDTNGVVDIFVHDRVSGVTERVSIDSAGTEADSESSRPSISADGRFVAFASTATNLVSGDNNSKRDIFVRDRLLATTDCVSVNPAGKSGDDVSDSPSISGDGLRVAFQSAATNLVTGDTNAVVDVFVRDRISNTTSRCSVDSAGAQASGRSEFPEMSPRGGLVMFSSHASDLVSGDANQR